jgi:Short C-terminal domain
LFSHCAHCQANEAAPVTRSLGTSLSSIDVPLTGARSRALCRPGDDHQARDGKFKGAAAERPEKDSSPMTELSPSGLRSVEEVAARTGFSRDAVTSMLASMMAGRGGMAQFSHPEFGGSGQWLAGGAIMISDMFNNALKARVDALCNELSALVWREQDFATADSFQSQSQGTRENHPRGSSSLLAAVEPGQTNWWPSDLGVPSSLGAQNEVRYSYFPKTRRLALDINGKITVYDTQDHQINGFSQQQPGSGSFSLSSQLGVVDVTRLPIVSGVNGAKSSSESVHRAAIQQQAATSGASGEREDVLTAIERLSELFARGILTEAEFSAKKAELLGRL